VFTILKTELQNAKTDLNTYVVADIRTYVDNNLSDLDQDLSVISSNFANTVNSELNNLTVIINMLRNNIKDTLGNIVEYQTIVQMWLNIHTCWNYQSNCRLSICNHNQMFSVNFKITIDRHLDPQYQISMVLPLYFEYVLMFNLTHTQNTVNTTLIYLSSYPFDYYMVMVQSDRVFYYFLIVYGVPVMLFGLLSAFWHIYIYISRS